MAIDFETANETSISACEIGVAVVRNNVLAETRGWLIRPPQLRFNPGHVHLHGIDADQVRHEPTFADLWEELRHYLQGELLLAHNAAFDMEVLYSLLRFYRIPFSSVPYACSLLLARRVWRQRTRSFSLNALCKLLNIELHHHQAQSDAGACARIAQAVFKEYQLTQREDIESRLHLIPGAITPRGLIPMRYKYEQPPAHQFPANPDRKSRHWRKR